MCSEYMGLHEIFPPGAGQNRAKLRKDIEQYHIAYAIDFDDTDIDPFIARRPDGLAFDKGKKICVFLEYTRAMDTNDHWAEKKEQEKNERYSSHLGFINHLSNRKKSGWKASQTNFTTAVRGSLNTNQFQTRLESLRTLACSTLGSSATMLTMVKSVKTLTKSVAVPLLDNQNRLQAGQGTWK